MKIFKATVYIVVGDCEPEQTVEDILTEFNDIEPDASLYNYRFTKPEEVDQIPQEEPKFVDGEDEKIMDTWYNVSYQTLMKIAKDNGYEIKEA